MVIDGVLVVIGWWSLGLDPRAPDGRRGGIFFLSLCTFTADWEREGCSSPLSPSEERGTCVPSSAGCSSCCFVGEVATASCCCEDSNRDWSLTAGRGGRVGCWFEPAAALSLETETLGRNLLRGIAGSGAAVSRCDAEADTFDRGGPA